MFVMILHYSQIKKNSDTGGEWYLEVRWKTGARYEYSLLFFSVQDSAVYTILYILKETIYYYSHKTIDWISVMDVYTPIHIYIVTLWSK